jgi:sugar phosphate isomerase/epimerase
MIQSGSRKYGFNIHHLTTEEGIAYAAANGLGQIEINLAKDHHALDTFTSERTKRLAALAMTNRIQISFHVPYYINIADIIGYLRRQSIRYLTRCIRTAGAVGVTHLTLHMGRFYWFPVEKWQRQCALKRFITSLSPLLKDCAEYNVVIALENLPRIPRSSDYYLLGDNAADFQFVFSQLDSPWVRFCFDTGHANIGDGYHQYLNTFQDKLACVHFHDNHGNSDAHLPVGEGTVQWGNIAQALSETGYTGPLISECRNRPAHVMAAELETYFSSVASRQMASPLKS